MIKADDLWSLEDLEHPQNAVICSLARYQHFLKIQLKSALNFWSDFAKLNAGRHIGSSLGGGNIYGGTRSLIIDM